MSDDWQKIPDLSGIPDEALRARVLEKMERNAGIDREARAIFDEHGWERVAAFAKRLVQRNERLRLLIDIGFTTGDMDGVLAMLDKTAKTAAAEGKHNTAVLLRLLSISTSSCGPPALDEVDPRAIGLANYLDDMVLPMPTHEDWEGANVDAALSEAEIEAVTPDDDEPVV